MVNQHQISHNSGESYSKYMIWWHRSRVTSTWYTRTVADGPDI